MPDDIIARAEAALEGVTDGPWVAEYSGEQGNCVIPHDAQSTREAVCTTHLYYQVADAEFIAAARQLVPELVAELKTTRAQLRQLSASLEEVWDDGNCTGLDGWIGPGRGTAEPDRDALHARDRVINKVLREIDGGG